MKTSSLISFKKFYYLLFILISEINISSETSIIPSIKIYSEELFKISCDSHFFYLSMKISSEVEINYPITFELNLISPSNLNMKCLIYKTKLDCFSFVPEGSIYRQEELFFNLFYNPPRVIGIEFDVKSFRKNSRRWENTSMCGYKNHLLNDTKVDFDYWKKIKLNDINGGNCKYFYEDKEQKNVFYFNMNIDIDDENLIKYLEENKERNIYFLQDMKAPVSLQYKDYINNNEISTKDYAFCQNKTAINLNNYKNIIFLCKIQIPKKTILNSIIKINSFFDKIYIETKSPNVENEIQTLNIFINATKVELEGNITKIQKYLLLNDGNYNNIICPNLPIFIIKNKNTGIFYDSYNEKTNRFIFYLNGTLTNGYKYINNSLIKLPQTLEEITFNLYLTDNSIDDYEEVQAKCILSSSSFYNEENTLIKCFANKTITEEENNNIIIDMNLNYVQSRNNYFQNIIINWPERQYFGNKKNFFSVKIDVLAVRKKYAICEDGTFFTFYVNIYDIKKETKIFFDLPLVNPQGYITTCEIFDQLSLACTIDLRYKQILKDEIITLPEIGKEIKIINDEGNEIIFTVLGRNNFLKMVESCGENIVFGAMKEIGISKKKGIIISLCLILFMLLIIGFCIFYIIHLILRCKKRGKKLPMTEESKIHKEITKDN